MANHGDQMAVGLEPRETTPDETKRSAPRTLVRAVRDMPATVLIAALVLTFIALLAIFGPILSPRAGQIHPEIGVGGPTSQHILGTDALGRDILARVIAGAQTSIGGPALMAVVTVAIATVLGLVAAYRGGAVDALLSRAMDFVYSMPHLVVALVIVGVTGGGYTMAVIVLIVLNIPQNYRLIRGPALRQRVLPYVEACQILGLSSMRIMARHLFPNVVPFFVSALFLRFVFAIVELTAFSFLGLGVPPGAADWGRMLAENREFLGLNPWATIVPGVALILAGGSANILGDWLIESSSSRGQSR